MSRPVIQFITKKPTGEKAKDNNDTSHETDERSQYEEIDKFAHTYDKLYVQDDHIMAEITAKLQNIQKTQDSLREDYIRQQEATQEQIRGMREEVAQLKAKQEVLQALVASSSSEVKKVVDGLQLSVSESIDHLGHQLLQVRRDIHDLNKEPKLPARSPATLSATTLPNLPERGRKAFQRYGHSFEWDITDVDSLVKNESHVASCSYHVGQMNYKVIGSGDFTKDGRMHLKMLGESTHMGDTRTGRFECIVNMVDRAGKFPDWVIGRIVGGFEHMFKGKSWVVGDLAVKDIRTKGYMGPGGGGTIRLRFEIVVEM